MHVAANAQFNSQFFSSATDKEKALQEVSNLIAEKLKLKPKVKNSSVENAPLEVVRYKKTANRHKRENQSQNNYSIILKKKF